MKRKIKISIFGVLIAFLSSGLTLTFKDGILTINYTKNFKSERILVIDGKEYKAMTAHEKGYLENNEIVNEDSTLIEHDGIVEILDLETM